MQNLRLNSFTRQHLIQLEPIIYDILDTMPRLRPVLGRLLSEQRHAGRCDARRAQHRVV